MGVHRQYVAPGKPKVETKSDDDVKFEAGWDQKPSLKNQISRGEDYWKLDRVEVRIFDLADAGQLQQYNEVLSQSSKPDASVILISNERQWNPRKGSWSACVELQHILYRKVLITEKNKDEKASGD